MSGREVSPSNTEIVAHPAIFTSIRTPTGEGYRIVASSRSLRVEEKQAITRFSPSHEALCSTTPDAIGLAAYPLATGRMCVAYTRTAGAEHTGRRGQRVYTYNLVIERADYERFGYNPFAVLRAAMDRELTAPQLKPKDPLPPVALTCDGTCVGEDGAFPGGASGTAVRRRVAHLLVQRKAVVLQVVGLPTEEAELLWMALPGPLRLTMSMSAGLRYSNTRAHHLVVVSAEDARSRELCEGQETTFIDAARGVEGAPERSEWLDFVERQWRGDRIGELSRRTSLTFADWSLRSLDFVGKWYLATDEVEQADVPRLLAMSAEFVDLAPPGGIERDIHARLTRDLQERLMTTLGAGSPGEIELHWSSLSGLWKRSRACESFAWPVARAGILRLADLAPLAAARLALSIAKAPDHGGRPADHDLVLVGVLRRFDAWATAQGSDPNPEIETVAGMWRHQRPDLAPILSVAPPAPEASPTPTTADAILICPPSSGV
ncbi:MAG: hypothetical protein FLDDKLPJ_03072 [Phycisphaerae bacterium]|nr:hypothetical protein [Phycisphaerae bacterium]